MTSPNQDPLDRFRRSVQNRIGANRYRTWFGDSTEICLQDRRVEIRVRNDFVGNWIANNYLDELVDAACEVFGDDPPPTVRIIPVQPPSATEGRSEGLVRPRLAGSGSSSRRVINLTPAPLRYDLDTFVVGASNRIAYAAAQQIVRNPGGSYKLLVLHSACGLGKTHLLQGICGGLRRSHPTLEWRYVSGEDFTNEYIFAVKSGRIDAFRARFRRVDVLVIDDIHFLANKKATQEEFLHTFDAIDTAGKAVVLSSDRHPRAISSLSEPLIDRLIAGMVVHIEPPDLETRREIVRRRATTLRVTLSEDVLEFVAHNVTRNVREIEGTLHSLSALADLVAGPITVDMAQKILLESVVRTRPAPGVEDIERITAARFGVTREQIRSKSRDRTVTLARGVAMLLVRRHTPLSFPEIGRAMGKKNHSTVLMATQRTEKLLFDDAVVEWKSAAGRHEAPIRGVVEALEAELFSVPR